MNILSEPSYWVYLVACFLTGVTFGFTWTTVAVYLLVSALYFWYRYHG